MSGRTDNPYLGIVNALFSAALDPREWDRVTAEFSAAMPGVRSHLFATDLLSGATIFATGSGYDPDFEDSFRDHYGAINAWGPAFAERPEGAVMSSPEMCADADLVRTEFYADWVRPQEDISAGGGAVLAKSAASACLIGGNIRRRDADRLEGRWMRMMEDLLAPMQQAWAISRALAGGALERRAMAEAADGDPAVLVLTEDHRPSFANAAALRDIARGEVLRRDLRDRVRFTAGSAQQRLDAFGARLEGDVHSAAFRIGGTAPRLVRLARFDPGSLGDWDLVRTLGIVSPSILVILTAPQGAVPPAGRVSAALGLSAAEAEVAVALASGLTPVQIAQRRGTRLVTVRNQIKGALARAGVTRQSDLVALVVQLAK